MEAFKTKKLHSIEDLIVKSKSSEKLPLHCIESLYINPVDCIISELLELNLVKIYRLNDTKMLDENGAEVFDEAFANYCSSVSFLHAHFPNLLNCSGDAAILNLRLLTLLPKLSVAQIEVSKSSKFHEYSNSIKSDAVYLIQELKLLVGNKTHNNLMWLINHSPSYITKNCA